MPEAGEGAREQGPSLPSPPPTPGPSPPARQGPWQVHYGERSRRELTGKVGGRAGKWAPNGGRW